MASMKTTDLRARLSEDRRAALCARDLGNDHYCPVELAPIMETVEWHGDETTMRRFISWDTDWRRWPYPPASPNRLRRTGWERKKRGYAPTREGWTKVLAPKPGKGRKSFGFDLPAECPECHLLNILDPERLDVTQLPKG
jgi:hypothetical protein